MHEIREPALQHEIRYAAGELCGLVRVAAEADCDFAGAPVDGNPLIGLGEHRLGRRADHDTIARW